MDDTETKTLFFKFGYDNSFHSLIALGDRAESMLNHLRAVISDLYIERLLHYKAEDKPARYLLVLADESSSIELLPAVYSDEDFIKHSLFVLDISDSPQPEKWPDAFSYIWFSPKQQYITVKQIFQMVYHDIFVVRPLNCFDFTDWKHTVRGKRRVVIRKFAVNDDLAKRLRQVPLSEVPDTRSLVNVAVPFEMAEDEDFLSMVNANLFKRFDDNASLRWTLLCKDFPIRCKDYSLQESYIALMEFIPL